ncbi:MAG: fasciclin domain-containing protein [Krumholzibacteria bacterium]|nr:fasciclin domain-containing protein [Candidatus Krumholzibacteria bacterium]
MRNLITAAALTATIALAVPALVAQAGSCGSTAAHTHDTQAILPLAEEAGFTTLVAAVKAAGLVEALSAKGPFTVFAPTEEAFAKLPEGTVEALLANPEQLKKVLLYHVVAGSVMAKDVVKLTSAETLGGQRVAIDAKDGVKVNDANVVKTDIAASNGVVHVIDTVLIPQDL